MFLFPPTPICRPKCKRDYRRILRECFEALGSINQNRGVVGDQIDHESTLSNRENSKPVLPVRARIFGAAKPTTKPCGSQSGKNQGPEYQVEPGE